MPPWLNFHDLIPVASRGYDITMTDLLNVFYRLDVAASGAVTRADFEAALVELGYTPPQAGTLFDSLDADGDGVLSMDDWTADASSALARLLAFRIIRRDVVGRDPRTTRRPPSSVTDQKVAMEMLLAKLGVTAKANFLQVKQTFDAMDKDGSGDVDGDELATTVERILRQKISRGVRESLMRRFDKNGDGTISPNEFMGKVLRNPVATLYSYLPGSIVLA